VFFVVGLGLPLVACTGQQRDGPADVVVVAVPVQPIAGLVDALAPDGLVDVVVLVPPGTNPATHQPSIQALRRLADARLYLEIGHPEFMFERTWLGGALDGSSADRVLLFEDCELQREDPHAWLSTGCLASAANATASALAGVFPTHNDEIGANLESFLGRLQETADSTGVQLAPYDGKVFFVLHSAWGYLARERGLRQIAIQSHGTGDPGASRIAELIRLGIGEGVQTIFVQQEFNPVSASLIAEELGATVVTLDPLARNPLYAIESATSALVAEFERGSPR
jgi:zinc transport system substrate-binding protein